MKAMSVRAAFVIRDILGKMKEKLPKKEFMNDKYASDLVRMSRNHHQYMSLVIFKSAIEGRKFNSPQSRNLLILLAKIYSMDILKNDAIFLYETGFFAAGSSALLDSCFDRACRELRPQLIPLIELNSEQFMDLCYLSAIGNKYGDIYESQLERAMNSKLSQKPKPDWFDDVVMPVFKKARQHEGKL